MENIPHSYHFPIIRRIGWTEGLLWAAKIRTPVSIAPIGHTTILPPIYLGVENDTVKGYLLDEY